jgi:peptidoglycan/LPS O-acetylase OafA/YrhL
MACYGLQDSSKPRLHFESTKQAFGVSFDDWTRRSALTIPAVVRRYQTLDGLRGIAALAVVMLHSNRWFLIAPNLSASAVDLFFLLSGFVVAAAYEHRLASGMSAARFMAIRIIRLYPLYLVGLLIALFGLTISLFTHGGVTPFHLAFWKAAPFAVLMLPSPSFGVMGNIYPLNGPAWSLMYELCINFIFAMTYRHWTLRNMGIVIVLTGITILIRPIALYGGWGHINFADGIFRVLFFFPLGVLLFRIEPAIPVMKGLRAWHCLVLFVAILYCNFGESFSLLILFAYPVLVALAITVEPSGLFARLCDKAGAWSYAIYAVHFPLIGLGQSIENKLAIRFNPMFASTAVIVGLMIFAELLDRFYDIPIRRRLTALLSRSSMTPASV